MAVDPTELTAACRAFLDTWGYNPKGEAGAYPPVAQQIIPVIQLGGRAGLPGGPRAPWLDLVGERFFTVFASEGATAAEFSALHILNPAGSTVDGYVLYCNHDQHCDYSFTATALGTGVTEASKQSAGTLPTCTVTQGTLVAAATSLWRSPTVSATDVHRDHFENNPWLIPPGAGLIISMISANAALQISMSWSEVDRT